jgi:hypothetical protein
MNIRVMNPADLFELKEIHSEFFSNEFEFPNFFNNFLSSFVVTDENGRIITGGGVRLIAESIIITDKDYPIEPRRKALFEMLAASAFTASSRDFRQIHAFIQDEKWLNHLKRKGFKETVGKSLVLNI